MKLKKAKATLGNVGLAATSGIAWRFVGGTAPYTTVFEVHSSKWARLEGQIGQPLNLKITDSRGNTISINQVYILHLAPSSSPHRVAFVVADKRWKWGYKLITRDYNMPRKTGDRDAFGKKPVETQTVVDKYDYLPYSLYGEQQEAKWTARQIIEDVLEVLEGEDNESGGYKIESFPIRDTSGGNNTGDFAVQNVTLRDAGDVALSRALSYVPGADVYINADGVAVVYDATDLDDLEAYYQGLPVATYAGEKVVWVDRKHVRPGKVIVHYQREVELLVDFSDDYSGGTSAQPSATAPFIENVCPTVDPETEIGSEFDPVTNQSVAKKVPPGTWVEMKTLLAAWDADRPEDSLPWTFDTIKVHWLKGDLEGVLGARGLDFDQEANIAMRVSALRQHFRQSFRINRQFMERTRSLRPVRVGLLDPVTGARAPAAVWGQACIVPSTKGKYMATRGTDDVSKLKVYRNVDYLAPSRTGKELIRTAPGPTRVNIVDGDLGIFRLEWLASPYGTVESFIPSNLVGPTGQASSVTRDLTQQDDQPMGPAMIVEGGTNGIFLANKLSYKAILTVVPAAPNNEAQFHKVEVEARDIATIFQSEFHIKDGAGPDLHLFVPPGEATARFALTNAGTAFSTLQDLFGLRSPEGITGNELPGYTLMNEERYLSGHAASLAAESIASFADNPQGTLVTRMPDDGLQLKGGMSSATVRVAAAGSAKVDAVHTFPGQQRQISRLAVMPESTRQIVLGIVPFS